MPYRARGFCVSCLKVQTAVAVVAALVGALLFVVMPSSAAAQDAPAAEKPAINLRPQYVAGRKSRFEFWTQRKQDISVSAGPRSQNASALYTFEGQIIWDVQAVNPDGSATCIMTLDWLSVKVETSNGQSQVSDSRAATGDNESMHRLIRAMAGAPLTCEMKADGSVTSVKGIDAIVAAAGEGLNVPDEKDYMESASDLATIPFSPGATQVGATWNASFDWSHEMGAMLHSSVFTLSSTETIADIPIATVTFKSDLTFKPDMSQVPQGGPPVDIRMTSGSAAGEIMFDLQRHEAVGRNTLQETTIVTTVNLPQGQLVRSVKETLQSQCLRVEEIAD